MAALLTAEPPSEEEKMEAFLRIATVHNKDGHNQVRGVNTAGAFVVVVAAAAAAGAGAAGAGAAAAAAAGADGAPADASTSATRIRTSLIICATRFHLFHSLYSRR